MLRFAQTTAMNDNVILPNSPRPNVYGPITPSEMFERTAALLRENFKLFFGIALVVLGVEIVVGGVLGGTGMWTSHFTAGAGPIAKALFMVPVTLLGAAVIFVFMQIVQGALFIATQAKLASIPMSVGEACRLAAEKVGRLIGIALLVALRIFGYVLLFYFAVVALFLVVTLALGGFSHLVRRVPFQAGHLPPIGLLIFGGIFLLGLLVLYLFVLLWLYARYALSIPAGLAENASVTEAIRRSIHLTRGSKGRLYSLFLVTFGIYVVVAAVIFPVQMMALHAAHAHHSINSTTIQITTMLIGFLEDAVSAIVITFVGVATALCYFDLRVRKEGFGATVATPTLEIPSPVVPPTLDLPLEDLPIS